MDSIKNFEDIDIGQKFSLDIDIDENLVDNFAQFSGDFNPLHMDQEYAGQTDFKNRVAHGMILGSFLSQIVGMHLPGPGALWLSQNIDWPAAVKVGDKVNLTVTVAKKFASQNILLLEVLGTNQHNTVVLKGQGKVKMLEEKKNLMEKQLNESKVLILGGSRGLGAQTALGFCAKGASVYVNYHRSEERAKELCDKARDLSGSINLIKADITSDEGIQSILDELKDVAIDTVVINALSDLKQGSFLEHSLEDFNRAYEFGVKAPVGILQGLLPKMVENKNGKIISILSTYALNTPPAGFSAYIVNKKALEGLTKSIAVEYGKYNIRANMISPNMLRTDLTESTPERYKKLKEAQTPLKRLAELDEVVEGILFLAGPNASYLSGHNLVLSGGEVIV